MHVRWSQVAYLFPLARVGAWNMALEHVGRPEMTGASVISTFFIEKPYNRY